MLLDTSIGIRGLELQEEKALAAEPRQALEAGALLETDELRRLIAEAAYYRAEGRGFEPGHDVEDWLAAEEEVMARFV